MTYFAFEHILPPVRPQDIEVPVGSELMAFEIVYTDHCIVKIEIAKVFIAQFPLALRRRIWVPTNLRLFAKDGRLSITTIVSSVENVRFTLVQITLYI